MKFTITITQKGGEYLASCQEMPEATAQADSKQAVLEKISAVIKKKLDDGADGGAASKPHPGSPPPQRPIIVVEAHKLPE